MVVTYVIKFNDIVYKVKIINKEITLQEEIFNHEKLLAVSTAAVAVTTGVIATADAATHTVKSGDTLFEISKQYGTTVDALKADNGLNSNLILPNQVLKLMKESRKY